MVIDPIVPSRFPMWVRQRPFQILFLGNGVAAHRPASVVRSFDLNWPGRVGAGWMARDSVPAPDWWERHWVTELGPFRPLPPPLGVWLFHYGWIAGHHPGTAHATSAATLDQVREYLIERIRLKIAGEEAASEAQGSSTSSGGTGRAGPTSLPTPARAPEPYEVLEIGPDASDDEVKAAYRTALKLNHPDKVAHLSKQIQTFAKERTQLIVAAWQAIKESRGLR